MTRVIYRERIPSTDPRLKRHILHDSESRRYAFDTTGLTITSVVHDRRIPILDQGQVGSCTAEAGVGVLGTEPLWLWGSASPARYPLTQAGAYKLYSDEESLDGDGPYPPNDNGSTGLTCAKVLLAAGEISGYQHTFSVTDALKALSVTPLMFGTNWYQDSFTPDPDGRIRIGGGVAGGHELEIREYDAVNQRVWLDNSWGTGWGVSGRCYLTLNDFTTLLIQQGDITVLLPLSAPAPVPTPVPVPAPVADADAALAQVANPWVLRTHRWPNAAMWHATQAWLTAKGL